MLERRIGNYQVLDRIGSGGMGELYRAKDVRLGREVALKFPTPELAQSETSRKRFEREARAIAALNHPHIVTIYSVERLDGVPFLTMELLEGRTLQQLIPGEGMPIRQLFVLAGVAELLGVVPTRAYVPNDGDERKPPQLASDSHYV